MSGDFVERFSNYTIWMAGIRIYNLTMHNLSI